MSTESTSRQQNASWDRRLKELSMERQREVINRLFTKLAAWYGNSLEKKWGGSIETAIDHWRQDLGDLTLRDLLSGVEHCRDSKYVPSLGEFREMCKPDYQSLFIEAQVQMARRVFGDDKWTNPLAYWAAAQFAHDDLVNGTYSALSAAWRAVVDSCRAKQLEPIPPKVSAPALPQPATRGPTDEERAAMDAIIKKRAQTPERMAWAWKILDKIKTGDQVPHISREYAVQALTEKVGEQAVKDYLALDTQQA